MISEQIWQFPMNCRDFHFWKSSLSRVLFYDFSNFLFFQFCPEKILQFLQNLSPPSLLYWAMWQVHHGGRFFNSARERENDFRVKWDEVQWRIHLVRPGNYFPTKDKRPKYKMRQCPMKNLLVRVNNNSQTSSYKRNVHIFCQLVLTWNIPHSKCLDILAASGSGIQPV